ncbi:hypothetical protein MHYP_G00149770 [Metynnis hypsauchen]
MAESVRAGANSVTANSYNTRARTLAGGGEDHPGPTQRTNKTTLNKPMSQAVRQWKNKVEVLQDRTDELEAENSFLKQQLEEQKEANNSTEVISRYRNVLRFVQKGYRMSKAFKKAHVSRNGIKHTAAIAEIYFADRTILDEFQGDYKLLDLAKLCESRIVGELASKIIEMKKKKELLPFKM